MTHRGLAQSLLYLVGMKRLLPVLLATLSLCAGARADLGDTPAQAESRYGAAQGARKEDTSGVTTKYYASGGFGVVVRFLGGKSESESYIKEHKAEFTADEIAVLLKANTLGSEWQSVYKTATAERWQLKSRQATALYSRTDHTFTFSTKEYNRASNRIKLIDSD